MTMNLHAIPAFSDARIWMLDHRAGVRVENLGEAAPVLAAPAPRGPEPAGILVTSPGQTVGHRPCRRAPGVSGGLPVAACAALREWKNRHR